MCVPEHLPWSSCSSSFGPGVVAPLMAFPWALCPPAPVLSRSDTCHISSLYIVQAIANFLTVEALTARDAHSKACFSFLLNYLVLRSSKIFIRCYKTKPRTTACCAVKYSSLRWYWNSRCPKEIELYLLPVVCCKLIALRQKKDAPSGNSLRSSAELLLARHRWCWCWHGACSARGFQAPGSDIPLCKSIDCWFVRG